MMENNMDNNNYNDVDAVFGVFKTPEYKNRQREIDEPGKVVAATEKKEKYSSYANPDAYKKIAQKTIGTNKSVKVSNKKTLSQLFKSSPILEKVAIILCSAAMVVALGTASYAIWGDDIAANIETRQQINKSTDILKTKAIYNLFVNGLATIDTKTQEFKIGNNSVSDYGKLNVTEDLDVYIYSLVLSDEEFSKLIKSATYSNGCCSYLNFEQFLRINGYMNTNNNTPSSTVFGNMMEAKISDMSDDLLREYGNGAITYDMIDVTATTVPGKGGK